MKGILVAGYNQDTLQAETSDGENSNKCINPRYFELPVGI